MRPAIICKVAAAALLITAAARAGGCEEHPQHEALRKAAVVFEGRVQKVELVTYELHDPPNRPAVKMPLAQSPAVVTFEVKRAWKGSPRKTVKGYLFTKPAQGSPFNFEVGQRYIVYTYDATTWEVVRGMGNGEPVYALTDGCLLRVRTDLAKEARRLGESDEP